MNIRANVFATGCFLSLVLSAASAWATEYHVATTGDDAGAGTSAAPYKTIQKAAETMQPGDSCIVHAGTYREWVRPRRGGTSDTARIVYQAAPGETVYIKGSELVTGWTSDQGVYKADVPNSVFGSFNPYSTNIGGDYLNYGAEYHLGGVYLDGEPLLEALDMTTVKSKVKTFFAQVGASSTTIWASFGLDPSTHVVEANVRETGFGPEISGLGYITLDGFNVYHGATQWSGPGSVQSGLVDTLQGHHWLIQNNVVSDSRTICILSGERAKWLETRDVNLAGNHIARRNTARRCGEAGFAGAGYWFASLIENNLIEDINWTHQFGGFETAGIKIHVANDVTIKNNVIRRVGQSNAGGTGQHQGIWLDWAGQGSRVTGNIIYDIDGNNLDFELDHGPQLADNNIIVGNPYTGAIFEFAENGVFVHNLFVTATWNGSQYDTGRSSEYVVPHTLTRAGSKGQSGIDDHYLNNVYMNKGTETVPNWPGTEIDYNVFYSASKKSDFGDANSIVSRYTPTYRLETIANGVRLFFTADTAVRDVNAPLITRDYIGINTTTNQGIENHDGTPITIDTDISGAPRDKTHPTAGPFENPASTRTSYLFYAGVGADIWGAVEGAPGTVVLPDGGTKPIGGTDAAAPRSDAGGGGSTGGGGTVGPAAGDDGSYEEEVVEPGGCGCRTANAPRGSLAWLALAALALGAGLRRDRPDV